VTLIDLCRELIAADSTTSAGTQEIAKVVCLLSQKLGLYSELQEEVIEGRSEYNVMVSPIPFDCLHTSKLETFLFLNHLDCSHPGPLALWTKHSGNPFDLIIEDNKLHGLGIAENKADIAAKLLALGHYKNQNLIKNPMFLGVFGHQFGMRGMQRWLKRNPFKISHVLVGEPTDLKPVFSVNGYARVDISIPYSNDESELRQQSLFKGVSATSTRLFKGTPRSGIDFDSSMDLLKQVFQYLENLPSNTALMDFDGGTQFNVQPYQILTEVDLTSNLEFPMIKKITSLYQAFSDLHSKMKISSNNNYTPSHLTFNIGMIRSNQSEVTLSGIVRIPPHISNEEIANWEQQAKGICAKLGARLQLTDIKPAYELAEDSKTKHMFKKSLERLGLASAPSSLYLSNEACLLGRKKMDCIVFGPGESSNNLHSPNEYVLVENANKAYHVYSNWILEETS